MKKCLLISLLFWCSHQVILGQQSPQYSLYMLNKYSQNIAYAGMDDYLSVTGIFRKQWLGLQGSPTTQNVNVHLPWQYLSGGAGLNIEHEWIGAERNTSAELSYNYILRLSKNVRFSIAIGGGFFQKSLDGSQLLAPEGNYEGELIIHNDDLLPIGAENAIIPMASTGAYLKMGSMEIGISARHLTQPTLAFDESIGTQIEVKRAYSGMASYSFNISDALQIQPSFLVQSDFVETQANFSILGKINGNIIAGAAFRGYGKTTTDALSLIGGVHIHPKLQLVYAYDYTLSSLSNYNSGSHELLLNYNLGKEIGGKIPAKTIYNPRFF